MRKIISRVFSFVLVVIIISCFSLPVFAVDKKVYDDASLLSSEEQKELNDKACSIADDLQMDIVIVTITDDEGKGEEVYAEDFYDNNKFGYGTYNDGVLLLLNMTTRKFWVLTTGNSRKYVDDARTDELKDYITPNLSSGNYYEAFNDFIDRVKDDVNSGIPDGKYVFDPKSGENVRNYHVSSQNVLVAVGIALATAVICIIVIVRRYKFHTIISANVYIDKNETAFREKSDTFLREYTTSVRIESNSGGGGGGGGGSSGGSSHGGSGGSF